jgi:hypothetical protein
VSTDRILVFGGRSAKGMHLGDLTVIDRASGQTLYTRTDLAPRARSTIAIDSTQGRIVIYGGEVATKDGVTPASFVEVLSLADGTTIAKQTLGVASHYGSAIGVGSDGWTFLVPGRVKGTESLGSAGAFVGPADALTFVPH